MREIIPFTITLNNIKYLKIPLTKQVKYLSDKNFKTVKKEIKKDMRIWKHLLYSWMGKINIVKRATLPKAIYTFNEILMKIPMQFFPALQKKIKFLMEKQNKTTRDD